LIRHLSLWSAGVVAILSLVLMACSPATHAAIKKDDIPKVFPWPRDTQKVIVQVMPQTTGAKIFSGFGSWETIELTPDTTFFITDDLGKEFAYTPSRSPMHRLAPVQTINIRWPIKNPKAPDTGIDKSAKQPDTSAQPPSQKPAEAPPTSENRGQSSHK
jgi:hypothetical protein